MSTTVNAVTLSDEVVQAASMIGKLVTLPYDETQYAIYSVEGPDYYAFRSEVGKITVDPNMTKVDWITDPVVTLLPTWAKMGDGHSLGRSLSQVRWGVSLVKAWV